MAEVSSTTAEVSSTTVEASSHTADASGRTADASGRTAEASSQMAEANSVRTQTFTPSDTEGKSLHQDTLQNKTRETEALVGPTLDHAVNNNTSEMVPPELTEYDTNNESGQTRSHDSHRESVGAEHSDNLPVKKTHEFFGLQSETFDHDYMADSATCMEAGGNRTIHYPTEESEPSTEVHHQNIHHQSAPTLQEFGRQHPNTNVHVDSGHDREDTRRRRTSDLSRERLNGIENINRLTEEVSSLRSRIADLERKKETEGEEEGKKITLVSINCTNACACCNNSAMVLIGVLLLILLFCYVFVYKYNKQR